MLVLDNHSSHMATTERMRFLLQERVVIVDLLPNTTHTSMVLDLSVFGPFKQHLRKLYKERYEPTVNMDSQFLQMLSSAIKDTVREALVDDLLESE